MKISFSRSSILTAIAIAIVVSALPGATRRIVQTGNPYLFTERLLEDMRARFSGPGPLRFLLQPMAALLLGGRDGKRDSQAKCPPFLAGLAFRRTHRLELFRTAIASVRDLVAIAIILDVISQVLIFRQVHPGAALLFGPVLIAKKTLSNLALFVTLKRATVRDLTTDPARRVPLYGYLEEA